ncbi:hypothetical protein CO033_03085 [Candidatus Nomurabacteria bacterium CG_4_9_14_0_2_um_filter_32_10]|uniref:DUF1653 domain-containing protein n=1 Tax=Candidatus Nomurabacteria bacterium CG_4_9_14_0_2_um_filter_32_10 TaxID=1974729 RepID=A0A2J0N3N5_9BACT|nr:MAG: hypothetical protein CO033_03085 [Candidatus Nomurabacteria bacterium CG_4_9_14_0_2_um_filter_32_10]
MQKLEIGGIYKHYKGTKAKVIAEALNSETLEPMVIYIHLEDGVVWARPKKMFLERIILNGHAKGRASKKVERFKKIKHLPALLPTPKLMQAGKILIKPRKK